MKENKGESQKRKAEILVNVLKGKGQLSDMASYCDFVEACSKVYKESIRVNNSSLKNIAIENFYSMNKDLIEIIRNMIDGFNIAIDTMSEIGSMLIDNEANKNDGGNDNEEN